MTGATKEIYSDSIFKLDRKKFTPWFMYTILPHHPFEEWIIGMRPHNVCVGLCGA